MKNLALYTLVLIAAFSCNNDDDPVVKCELSATVDGAALCYEDSNYLIAYASVAGEPSVFSLRTSYVANGVKGHSMISIETTEFTGPGTYTLRSFDGGSERSTYGYFAKVDIENKKMTEYNSVSGTLKVESVKPIAGTSNGLATGSFAMTAKDEQGNAVIIAGSFSELRGMGWWD